jgi:tRNA G37 N-methylase Trm5
MGVFPAPKAFVKEALSLAKDKGTIYHYEGVIAKEKYLDLYNEFNQIALVNNFNSELISHRFIKSYGPNLYHVVLDIEVSKKK